jgi:hypothetical protein
LSSKHYAYIWMDGINFNVRLDDELSCILVIIGATRNGTKELLAVQDGFRESKLAWQEILLDLKAWGLRNCQHWPSETERLVFGLCPLKSSRSLATNAAGCTRPLERQRRPVNLL